MLLKKIALDALKFAGGSLLAVAVSVLAQSFFIRAAHSAPNCYSISRMTGQEVRYCLERTEEVGLRQEIAACDSPVSFATRMEIHAEASRAAYIDALKDMHPVIRAAASGQCRLQEGRGIDLSFRSQCYQHAVELMSNDALQLQELYLGGASQSAEELTAELNARHNFIGPIITQQCGAHPTESCFDYNLSALRQELIDAYNELAASFNELATFSLLRGACNEKFGARACNNAHAWPMTTFVPESAFAIAYDPIFQLPGVRGVFNPPLRVPNIATGVYQTAHTPDNIQATRAYSRRPLTAPSRSIVIRSALRNAPSSPATVRPVAAHSRPTRHTPRVSSRERARRHNTASSGHPASRHARQASAPPHTPEQPGTPIEPTGTPERPVLPVTPPSELSTCLIDPAAANTDDCRNRSFCTSDAETARRLSIRVCNPVFDNICTSDATRVSATLPICPVRDPQTRYCTRNPELVSETLSLCPADAPTASHPPRLPPINPGACTRDPNAVTAQMPRCCTRDERAVLPDFPLCSTDTSTVPVAPAPAVTAPVTPPAVAPSTPPSAPDLPVAPTIVAPTPVLPPVSPTASTPSSVTPPAEPNAPAVVPAAIAPSSPPTLPATPPVVLPSAPVGPAASAASGNSTGTGASVANIFTAPGATPAAAGPVGGIEGDGSGQSIACDAESTLSYIAQARLPRQTFNYPAIIGGQQRGYFCRVNQFYADEARAVFLSRFGLRVAHILSAPICTTIRTELAHIIEDITVLQTIDSSPELAAFRADYIALQAKSCGEFMGVLTDSAQLTIFNTHLCGYKRVVETTRPGSTMGFSYILAQCRGL